MKEIKLTRNQFVLVDDADHEWLNQWKWKANKKRDTYYAERSAWVSSEHKYKSIFMHRLIMNTPIGLEVDHIDHNGLNNQRSNLRNCTRGENLANRLPKSTTGYLGVCEFLFQGKYKYIVAAIRSKGKIHRLGYFKTIEDAALAYNEAAKKYHGEYANLNIIRL